MQNLNKSISRFLESTYGGGTVMSLFMLIIMAVVLGLGLDSTNGWKNRTFLTSVADIGAHAGAVAIANGSTEAEVVEEVRRLVETNLPRSVWGNVLDTTSDVELAEYDIDTKQFVIGGTGDKNAVIVKVERTRARGNPVKTMLMQFVGIYTLDTRAISAGVYDVSGECNATDGLFAKEQVRVSSQGWFGPGICLHSEDRVWLPQNNTFKEGSFVSMPDLDRCENKCEESANPGIDAYPTHYVFPDFGDFISETYADFAGGGETKSTFFSSSFFKDNPSNPFSSLRSLENLNPVTGLTELIDVGALSIVDPLPSIGHVVPLTQAQFHAIEKLPSGLVYTVDCSDSGNGPSTRITFDGSTAKMDHSVLLTDCNIEFDDEASVVGSVVITDRVSSNPAITAGQNTIIGDPLNGCKEEERSTIMTVAPISVPSEFVMSNVTLIVDNSVNIASGTSSNPTSKGVAVYATDTINVASQHTFESCGQKSAFLTPQGKYVRLVMPPS
jgi:hypothetical protein